MVLGFCIILALATATLGQEQELDKIIKNLDKLVQDKKHNEVVKEKLPEKFSNLGKFRQAVIGSQLKYGQRPIGIPSPPPLPHSVVTGGPRPRPANQVLERFRAYTRQKTGKGGDTERVEDKKETQTMHPVAPAASGDTDKVVVEQLHNLVTGEQKTPTPSSSPSSLSSTTPAPSLNLAQAALPSQVVVPSPLGLTSDTHHKRSAIHDLPEGDGLFLVVVLCVAVCCILGVVGVGYCVHHPTCHRSSSPFSDASPSFHSAQLAFSSSPEDRPGEAGQGQHSAKPRSVGPAETHTWKDARSSPASRAHKFRSGGGGGQGAGDRHVRHPGVQRMESLIDIGPEEDDEDDMIYECPGLAPHGEMEVTNPFFLSKGLDLDLEGMEVGKMAVSPCPVNINNNMRHKNIHRNIQPGQQ